MQTSDHAIALARPKGMTPQRVTGLIFAGLLQAALILALIEGLNIKVWPTPVTGTTGTVIKTAPSKPGPPPTLNMHEPTLNNPVEPRFVIDNGQPQQGDSRPSTGRRSRRVTIRPPRPSAIPTPRRLIRRSPFALARKEACGCI